MKSTVMKRLLAALLTLMLLPCLSMAEGRVINLIDQPDTPYAFAGDAELLTIVFPDIHGSDCAILMYQDEVFMIDCSTDDQSPEHVVPVLEQLGITRVHTAFNSHPHDDHLTGFEFITDQAQIDRVLIAFPPRYNNVIIRTHYRLTQKGIPFETVQDGDVLSMGDGGVSMDVIQRDGTSYTTNDKSAMLMVSFGQCRIFFAGDIENRGQAGLLKRLPEGGVHCDILKYPHHGHAEIKDDLFDLIDPELAIVTAHQLPAKAGFAYLERRGVPGVSTWYGSLRLRTDGQIWVLDNLPAPEVKE